MNISKRSFQSTSLNVKLKFWLKQILKVDERDQIVNVYCWLELVSPSSHS